MPNTLYKGQKLIILVANKTPETAKSVYPNPPEMIPVKNSTNTTANTNTLIILSALAMFDFIILFILMFLLCQIYITKLL